MTSLFIELIAPDVLAETVLASTWQEGGLGSVQGKALVLNGRHPPNGQLPENKQRLEVVTIFLDGWTWVQLGCNKTSQGLPLALTVAIGAVNCQTVTFEPAVPAEAAGSSPVVPANSFEWLSPFATPLRWMIFFPDRCDSGKMIEP